MGSDLSCSEMIVPCFGGLFGLGVNRGDNCPICGVKVYEFILLLGLPILIQGVCKLEQAIEHYITFFLFPLSLP